MSTITSRATATVIEPAATAAHATAARACRSQTAITESNEKVEEGSRIVPVYRVTDLMSNSDQDVDGEEITFSERSGITREALEDGYYVMTARISDQRGDTYYSPVVGATVKGGKVVEWKTDPNFYGKSY